MKIVIVEDNVKIRTELKEFLLKYNYEVFYIENFADSVNEIIELQPNLVLLDINLPVFDGYYICREIRAKSKVPIIMVTSRNSEVDELMSMNLGADDFITKPYNTQILLAHIASVLKRTYASNENEVVEYRGLCLELSKSTVLFNNSEIALSKNEFQILHLLIKNQDTITKRDNIMEYLWQSDEFVDDNTLTVNVNRLRKKLEEIGATDFIKTKRGQGYSL
ncbi:MAG: response regulator transcription factor [Lachnospiraceae bacterium]|nr:response regulator transcription factor [Lachnospiraceae bacterium]